MRSGLFLVAGHNGLRLTSPDGLAWSAPAVGKEGETYRSAAGGNGRLVCVGGYSGDNIFASTSDGVAWRTSKKDAGYSRYLRGLHFGDGRFYGLGGDPGSVGQAKPFLYTSADGEAWDGPLDVPGKHMVRRLASRPGTRRLFVAVGDRGRRSYSADGKTWLDAPEAKPLDTLTDVACGRDVFVGVGLHGLRTRTTDGKTWTHAVRADEGEHLNTVVWADQRFVAVGVGVTFTSPDGTTWERHANTNAPLTLAYGNGVFVGTRWKGKVVRSTDGVTWADVLTADHHLEAVAYG